jgi:hypothetical protein
MVPKQSEIAMKSKARSWEMGDGIKKYAAAQLQAAF